MSVQRERLDLSGPDSAARQSRPDGVILVYDADSGVRALLLDVIKKVVGREECALCEITYSPIGKRRAWRQCESRLGVTVTEMHRDQLPAGWGIKATELPCVLARVREAYPSVLVTREEILSCRGSASALERAVVEKLERSYA
jgi:hypothetical protein